MSKGGMRFHLVSSVDIFPAGNDLRLNKLYPLGGISRKNFYFCPVSQQTSKVQQSLYYAFYEEKRAMLHHILQLESK